MDYNKLHKEFEKWKEEKIITEEQFEILEDKYAPKKVKEKKEQNISIKTLIIFSIVVIILGVLSLIGQRNPQVNTFVVPCSLIFLIAGLIYLGRFLEAKSLSVVRFLGKLIIVGSCLLTTFTVLYFDILMKKLFDINILGSDWSVFILIAGLVLAFISYKIENKIILGYSLFSIIVWFICEGKICGNSYASYWLGLTFPMRMFVLSLIFILQGFLHTRDTFIFKNFKFSIKNEGFGRLYYTFGIFTMFIPVWIASFGGLITNPLLPIKNEILLFVLLSMTISICLIYLGIIRRNKTVLNYGLAFLILEVYGKLYQFIYNRAATVIFYALVFIIAFGVAIIVEYILKHHEQIREELLRGDRA